MDADESNWLEMQSFIERSLKAASPTLEYAWKRVEREQKGGRAVGWHASDQGEMLSVSAEDCGSLKLAVGWEAGTDVWCAAKARIPRSWVFPSEFGPDDVLRVVLQKLISDALEQLPRFRQLKRAGE